MRSTRIAPKRFAVVAGVVEQIALAVWIGALVGFAFLFAPIAFKVVTSLDMFAALTGRVLDALAIAGYVCGGIALVAIVVRTADAADRTSDVVRIALIVVALGGVAYQSRIVAPQMTATLQRFGGSFDRVAPDDPRRTEYRALHTQSSQVYGAVLLFGLITIGIAAARRNDV